MPHFEKMLYDQAQLALLYLQAWQATGDPEYRRVTEETLDYVVREMTHPEGGFYSTQDADSEGEEGKFFLWDSAEMEALLDPETARVALHYWGVADGANFEGRSILHVPRDPGEVAAALGLAPDRVSELLRAGSRRPVRAPRGAGQARPGREGAVGLEWHDAPRLRRGVARARAPRLPRARRAERRVPPVRTRPGWPAPPDLEGRPGEAPRVPGRPRDGGRRAPRAPRGDARSAVARRRPGTGPLDDGPLLGPGGRGVLRHRAGPRSPRRAAAESLRLGGSLRLVGGGRRPASPRRAHRGRGSRSSAARRPSDRSRP